MKKLFFTVLLLVVLPAWASHIVGGEFELLHVSGNSYKLNMILYFDLKNGDPRAKDTVVVASIYSKATNTLIRNVRLHLYEEKAVSYTQPACSSGELNTSKIFYSSSVTLEPEVFNEPAGYYVSWQRCCRNYTITNIVSEDPNTTPPGIGAGQTFYLEFPPVVKDNVPFINSSPRLFPPLNDFACPGRIYYVNFTGTDDDGDSLVYQLVTPLSTFGQQPLPPTKPGPYPEVVWQEGFSLKKIIKGAPDLSISTDGYLRCVPKVQGLFVFAVAISQYRNKIKIGETRRDFQMLVVDGCQPSVAPVIKGKKSTDASFIYDNTMSVSFTEATPDDQRCIQVRISDDDSKSALQSFREVVGVRVIPLGFKGDNMGVNLPAQTTAVLQNGSTQDFTLCFTRCPPTASGKFRIGIVAFDDACSLPLLDTLKIDVYIEPHYNTAPYFVAPVELPASATLNEGEQIEFPVEIHDDQPDSLMIKVQGIGFDMAGAGMTFVKIEHVDGRIRGTLKWDAFCAIYNFTQRTSFVVRITVDDLDPCSNDLPVTADFNLKVILPGFADVFIDTDLTPDPNERHVLGLQRRIGEKLTFNVTGRQADGDVIKLSVQPQGFKLEDHGMQFAPANAPGTVTSNFTWDITCASVNPLVKNVYNFWFLALDNTSKCRVPKWDTVEVEVRIQPGINNRATLTMESVNDIPLTNRNSTIKIGQTIAVKLTGTDVDIHPPDNPLSIKLIEATGTTPPEGYTFADANGISSVSSVFEWKPTCSIFTGNLYSNNYAFRFVLNDPLCYNNRSDTVTLYTNISDVENGFTYFNPPNVITPNGDGCNDYFALEGVGDGDIPNNSCHTDDPDGIIRLPLDNCVGAFEYIRIYNRWGKEVFRNSDRRFRWYAQNADAGVYFYLINFGVREFKGSLSVRP